MHLRSLWVTLICLTALAAVSLHSLAAKAFTASVAASAAHGSMVSRDFESDDHASQLIDRIPSQGDTDIYLPLTNKEGTAASPTATSTMTPTATATMTSTIQPPPSATPIVVNDAELFVDDTNTTGTEDGSPEHPFRNVQAAIDTVIGSEPITVAVASGLYTGNVRIQEKTIHLYGGFVGGTITDYAAGEGGNFDDRYPLTNTTHLQGDGTDSVVTLLDAGPSTVDGFRITDGTRSITNEFADRGGGLFVSGGAPTISYNLIENNNTIFPEATERAPIGGGIFAQNSDILISNNTIRNNISGRGAGIAIDGGMVRILDNIIQDNRGVSLDNGDHGGGLYIFSPQAEISRNLIIGNEIGREVGYGWGGGIIIYGQGTFATLSYNIIKENFAHTRGSGIFIDEGARALLHHELIYNNQCVDNQTSGGVGIYVDAEQPPIGSHITISQSTIVNNGCNTLEGGNGLYVDVYSTATVVNSIFWGNNGEDFLIVDDTGRITATYTLSEEAIDGDGNLVADPLFADAAQHDYHLRSTAGRWDPTANDGDGDWVEDANVSPAIDAGDPEAPFANEPAPNGARANLGAFGNTVEASKSVP